MLSFKLALLSIKLALLLIKLSLLSVRGTSELSEEVDNALVPRLLQAAEDQIRPAPDARRPRHRHLLPASFHCLHICSKFRGRYAIFLRFVIHVDMFSNYVTLRYQITLSYYITSRYDALRK